MISKKYRHHLMHSAKGSEWKNHKYIKRVDGTYYYPDSYEGGRHLPDGEKGEGSKFEEYSDGDSDFDEKNFSDKNRLGDTDFYGFQKPDGTWVILEEDMKWTLPAGTKITPELIARLENFDRNVEARRQNGEKVTGDDWNKAVKDAIDGTGASNNGKLSDRDVEALAKEVVRGNFGNGQQRKDLFGEDYAQVQAKVNELMRASKSSTKSDDKKKKNSNVKQYKHDSEVHHSAFDSDFVTTSIGGALFVDQLLQS